MQIDSFTCYQVFPGKTGSIPEVHMWQPWRSFVLHLLRRCRTGVGSRLHLKALIMFPSTLTPLTRLFPAAAGSTAQQSEEQKGLVYPLCTTCSTPNIRRTHLEMSCWVHLAAALPSGVGTVQIRHELTETGSDIKWTTTLPSIKSFILQSVELLQNKNKVHAWLSNLPATQLTWCLCGPHDATLTGSPVTV